MKFALTLATIALSTSLAHAEVWTGEGQIYSPEHTLESQYTLRVEVHSIDTAKKHTLVTVSNPRGDMVYSSDCVQEGSAGGWKKSCSDGSQGGGYFFDPRFGMGIDYIQEKDGTAYATTIILDSKQEKSNETTAMRLFRTELKDGKATHFFVEKLRKVDHSSAS